MKKSYILCALLLIMCGQCFAQKAILYVVDNCVQDSLKAGIRTYESMYKKMWKELNLAVLVEERDGEFDFVLQVYAHLPPSGLSDLIKYSNRLLVLDKNVRLPVLLTVDKLSQGIRRDGIAFIPMMGYHVKVVYEQGQQKVIYTGLTF